MSAKPKVLYKETYKRGTMIRPEFLPTAHPNAGHEIVAATVHYAGRYDDGTEFQNVTLMLREKK